MLIKLFLKGWFPKSNQGLLGNSNNSFMYTKLGDFILVPMVMKFYKNPLKRSMKKFVFLSFGKRSTIPEFSHRK
jgi:hypothetical protein